MSSLFFPRKCYGQENIPKEGGFILASNHISNLDPVVLGVSSVRRLNFMAKAELFKKQPLGFILTKLSAFPVRRDEADFGAIKQALKRLNKGGPVLVFVEGTRRIGDTPMTAQPGVGFLALKARVPVIPVYVDGTQHAMPPGSKFFTRHPVTVRFGLPVDFNPSESNEEVAQTILNSIYSLGKT